MFLQTVEPAFTIQPRRAFGGQLGERQPKKEFFTGCVHFNAVGFEDSNSFFNLAAISERLVSS
jgi:hypothetical protein